MKPCPAGTWEQRPRHLFVTAAPSFTDAIVAEVAATEEQQLPNPQNLIQSFNTTRKDPDSSSLPFALSFQHRGPQLGCLKGGDESREKESGTYTHRSEQME